MHACSSSMLCIPLGSSLATPFPSPHQTLETCTRIPPGCAASARSMCRAPTPTARLSQSPASRWGGFLNIKLQLP